MLEKLNPTNLTPLLTVFGLFLNFVGTVFLATPEWRLLWKYVSKIPIWFNNQEHIVDVLRHFDVIVKQNPTRSAHRESFEGEHNEGVFNYWMRTIQWTLGGSPSIDEYNGIRLNQRGYVEYKFGAHDQWTEFAPAPKFEQYIKDFEFRKYRLAGLTLLGFGFLIQVIVRAIDFVL